MKIQSRNKRKRTHTHIYVYVFEAIQPNNALYSTATQNNKPMKRTNHTIKYLGRTPYTTFL